jgi:hypothetical protein
MDEEAKRRLGLAAAWCGPIFVVTYTIFWGILGHNIPPPNMMALSADQLISEYYGKYQSDILIGMIGCCVAGGFYLMFSLQLASMMRDENGNLGLTAMMELGGGILTSWSVIFCPALWATAAIFATSGIDPVAVKMLHVATWIIYDCTFVITTIQCLGVALYTILNKKQTMFPHWAGWCAVASGSIFVGVIFIPFVTEGPFTVSGIWNFYIVFGVWLLSFFLLYSYFAIRAMSRPRDMLPTRRVSPA